jgi:iron complex transport system permease protein
VSVRAIIVCSLACAVLALAVAARLWLAGDLSGLSDQAIAQAMELRALRVGCAMIVGAALGVAGALLQSLVRNPLASPDLIGATSGASLGVMLAAFIAGRGLLPSAIAAPASLAWQSGPALLGSAGALALVYLLSVRQRAIDPLALVLTGVIVSIVCSSAVMFLMHLMPDAGFSASRMLIGSISDDTTPAQLIAFGFLTGGSIAIALVLAPAIDASSLGHDEATSVGVDVRALRTTMFILCAVLSAAAVVLAGPIGFVGLIAPHASRLLLARQALTRPVLIASALLGATLLVCGDWLVRVVGLGSGRMPIGILTALIGGPAFVMLLRRQR